VGVDGIKLFYAERGIGEPIIFVHGAFDDYQLWTPFLNQPGYRTVTYSRRYNFPNPPSDPLAYYSALVDAEDLRRLSSALGIKDAHLVGHSYGGYVALFFALKNPGAVKSMVLCEPAILSWLPRLPGGETAYNEFFERLWKPFRQLAREDDKEAAIWKAAEFFYGKPLGQISEQVVEFLRQNFNEWKVLIASSDPFPQLNPVEIRDLEFPTLMLSGEDSLTLHKIIDQELQKRLRRVTRQIIPNSSHDMWRDAPSTCEKAMKSFLSGLTH